jgi:hypothetical protein
MRDIFNTIEIIRSVKIASESLFNKVFIQLNIFATDVLFDELKKIIHLMEVENL